MDRKNNPFAEEPPHKAFYHPSSSQDFSKQVKSKSALQSEFSQQEQENEDPLESPDRQFIKGGSRFTAHMVKAGDNYPEKFDESWPDSERPSTMSIPELSMMSPISHDDAFDKLQQHKRWLSQYVDNKQTSDSMEGIPLKKSDDKETESTLRKYIERFRHGTPMSREERQKKAATKKEDFWWTQKQKAPSSSSSMRPSESSTPKDEQTKTRSRLNPTQTENKKAPLPVYPSSNPWGMGIDEQTRQLQSKADQVLEKSAASSQLSTEPAVSTDGLGSTGSTSTFSAVPEETPYRPAFIRNTSSAKYGPLTEYSHQGEDILQQWRLRRKMEQARQAPPRSLTTGETAERKEVDEEVASKLAAFRHRLKEPGQVHFTPAPQSQAPQAQAPQAQAPQALAPQALAPQALAPQALAPQALAPQSQAPQAQAPQAQAPQAQAPQALAPQAQASQTQAPHSTVPSQTQHQVPSSHSQIASPHLVRTAGDTVPPHMHLSCDVLPCPQHPPPNPAVSQPHTAAHYTHPAVQCSHTAGQPLYPAVQQPHTAAHPTADPAVIAMGPAVSTTLAGGSSTHPAVNPGHVTPPQQVLSDSDSTASNEPSSGLVLSKPPQNAGRTVAPQTSSDGDGDSTTHRRECDGANNTEEDEITEEDLHKNSNSDRDTDCKRTAKTRTTPHPETNHARSTGAPMYNPENHPKSTGAKSSEVPFRPQSSDMSPSQSRASVGGYPSYESDRLSFDPDISDRLLPHVAPFCQDSDSSFEKVKIKHLKELQREKKAVTNPFPSPSSPALHQPAPGEKSQKSQKKDPRRTKSDSRLKEPEGETGRKARTERREERPRKNITLHSSPKSGLKDTIGQVIGEHLFLPSDSVLSSIECHTSPPKHPEQPVYQQSTQKQPPQKQPGPKQSTSKQPQHSTRKHSTESTHKKPARKQRPVSPESPPTHDDWGNMVSSDSEDFPDDDLLRDLRQRRSVHLLKLRAIDTLLHGSQSPNTASS